MTLRLILASASPRRAQLLAQLGYRFEVRVASVDETLLPGEAATTAAARLARTKAQAVAMELSEAMVVLGADTLVTCDEEILGKPGNAADGLRMLRLLADRPHVVVTAVAVCHAGRCDEAVVETAVTFGPISAAQCRAYWETGEPADKAGGYAIQGLAARFVKRIEGSYSGVMGLPLYETVQLLDPLLESASE